MADSPRDDDLDDRLADLRTTLDDLRRELRPHRGPLGLPQPPSAREVLRLTDEYAIPAAIAVLEANVRTLELLQRAIRTAEDRAGGRRSGTAGRESFERLDRVLDEFERAIDDSDLPASAEARRLLQDARRLNDDIRDRVDRATPSQRDRGIEIEVEEEAAGESNVEDELDSIRDEVEEEDG